MTCPKAGLWRAWLDQEPVDRVFQSFDFAGHLSACSACRETVGELRHNAALASRLIGGLIPEFRVPSPEPQVVLASRNQRLMARAAVRSLEARSRKSETRNSEPETRAAGGGTRSSLQEGRIVALPTTLTRWRIAAGGLAAALILLLVIGTPDGRSATAQFLAQFRSQRFAVVQIDPGQSRSAFVQLERLGTVQGAYPAKSGEKVATVAEAGQRVGFAVKQPDPATLPAGVNRTPEIRVSPASQMRFTFDRAKARAYFDSIGRSDVSLPDRFHGASLVVSVPAAVLLDYKGSDGGPGLLIGQARELEVGVDGNVTLDELGDFLIDLPGNSPETKRQLRAIKARQNTLPIPVPVDQVNWQETTIAGGQGLILADNSGLGSGAIWQRDGLVHGVAGPVTAAKIHEIADSLSLR